MAVAQGPRRSALALAGFGVLLAYPSWAFAVSSMHRRKVERALRDSETTYRNLIEMAPDAVLIVDGAGRIILMNSQAEQVFGYSRDELIGRPVEALLPTELRADHESIADAFSPTRLPDRWVPISTSEDTERTVPRSPWRSV